MKTRFGGESGYISAKFRRTFKPSESVLETKKLFNSTCRSIQVFKLLHNANCDGLTFLTALV